MAGRRKNGAGTIRERKDGRWEGRIIIGYDDNGKPKTKSVFGKTKTECTKNLKEFQNESYYITGKLPTQTKPDMYFGEWINMWYQNYCKNNLRESTQADYESRIYGHIIPSLGNIKLNELTQNDLQDFYISLKANGRIRYADTLGNTMSDRMVRACHANCRASLEKAVKEGLITLNPAIGCKLPPKKSREMQVLTHEEIQRFLIQAKNDDVYELYLLALTTGMRRGEIAGLQWDDLNVNTGELKIQRQVFRVKGKITSSSPKTKSSIRTVKLPKAVVNILLNYKDSTKGSQWMFPSPVKEEDVPRDPVSIYKKMQRVLERADCKKIRFHDLRHTFATMALESGMDVKTLSAMIGHVSSATTIDIYSHVTPEMKSKAACNIDKGFGKADTSVNEAEVPTPEKRKYKKPEFKPQNGKIRKSGSGGIYQINENLWEGSFTPTHADGKRKKHTVYAKTREECEERLEKMITEVREQIAEEKSQMNGLSM